ncbi:MAG: hypothetical protein ACFCUT_06750 [Kiloniellaceae bacterium]
MRAQLAAALLLAIGACTSPQQDQATAEQYICSDPPTRSAKGGQVACESFYAAYRAPEDPCAGAGSTLECVKLLRGLEMAGFSPNPSAGLIQPLSDPLTLGTAAVQGALNTHVVDMTITQGQTRGKITITTETLVDVSSGDDKTILRIETLSRDIDTQRISPADRRNLEAKHQESVGEIVTVTLNRSGGLSHISFRKGGGAEFAYDTDALGRFASLVESNYHGGRTVRQGDEAMRFDLSELLPSLDPSEGSISYSGKVVGKSVKNGRPAIVVSLLGTIMIEGQLVQGTGTYYVDMATGLALNGDMLLSGFSKAGASAEIRVTQSTALQ